MRYNNCFKDKSHRPALFFVCVCVSKYVFPFQIIYIIIFFFFFWGGGGGVSETFCRFNGQIQMNKTDKTHGTIHGIHNYLKIIVK